MKKRLKKDEREDLKKETLKESINEGSWFSVMSGTGTNYITPFALILNATNFQIGLLTSLVGLISPFSQLYGSRLIEKHPRKEIIMKFASFQALMWLPIIALVFLFWQGIALSYLPWMLILFYLMLMIFGSIVHPAWFSMMGDVIPENRKGRYFGLRRKIVEMTLLITTILAAFLLDYFETRGMVLVGFAFLFSIAAFSRFRTVASFREHYEPPLKLTKGYYFSLKSFLTKGLKTNFGKFTTYSLFVYLAVMIASPFFAVYLLEDLQLSYKLFMVVFMSANVFSIIFLPIVGKISDRFGSRFLLKLGATLIPLVPLLWLFSSNVLYLIFIPQLIGGLGWAAFSISSASFIYDSVKPNHRGLCIAYFHILIGIGTFIGALIGGFLTSNISYSFMNPFLFVFLVSGVLRGLAGFIFIPRIKEVRKLKRIPHFRLSYLNPTSEIIHDLAWIKKKTRKINLKLDNSNFFRNIFYKSK